MTTVVTSGKGIPVSKRPIEFVERKGKGHPDTICDRAAEELSITLSKYYLEKYGRILHHNVDKAILVGGKSSATFGGGEIIEPIYLMLVGRGIGRTSDDIKDEVPIGKMAVSGTKEWLSDEIRYLDVNSDIIIDYKIRSGSTDLVGNYDTATGVPKANDTSFAVAFAPFSDTEKIVLEVERELNSTEVKKKYPAIGEDIKVMGIRQEDKITLTIACPMISRFIPDKKSYLEYKEKVCDIVLGISKKQAPQEIVVQVNTADIIEDDLCYLTVTGTSAEHGDDGQVGRGNRANGLITPFRPMTLEASCGKNPISHVGKIYNVAARMIVDRLTKEDNDIEQAYAYIVSEIGKPINEPQVINVEVFSPELSPSMIKRTKEISEDVMKELPDIWRGFLTRSYRLY